MTKSLKIFSTLLLLTTTLVISGCISQEAFNEILQQSLSGDKKSGATASPSPSPRIVYFKAEPPEIGEGGTSLLKWKTENAKSVAISGIGAVTPASAGQVSVRPGGSATYQLTATNAAGQFVKESTKITVMVPLMGDLPSGFTPQPSIRVVPKPSIQIRPQTRPLQNLEPLSK